MADIIGAKQDLPLQIVEADRIGVDQGDVSDARRRQIQARRSAQAPGADNRHPGAAQRLLTGAANLAQHDVAREAFDIDGSAHG